MHAFKPAIGAALTLALITPALAAEPPAKPSAPPKNAPEWPLNRTAPDTQYCLYAGQPYSVGSVLNGRFCGRNPRAADTEVGTPPQAPEWLQKRVTA